MNPCLPKIKSYVRQQKLKISDRYLESMSRILEQERAETLTNSDFLKRADELIAEYHQYQFEKIKAANSMIIEKRERDVRRIVSDKETPTWERFRNLIQGGAVKPGMGTNLDPKHVQQAIRADLEMSWKRSIEKYSEQIADGALDREIYIEREALEKLQPTGSTKSVVAVEVAKAIHGLQNMIFDLSKANNPFMEKIQDYLMKQFHDREKISAAPKEHWVQSVYDKLSDKAFEGSTEAEKIQELGDIYERIRDGAYGSVTDESASDKYITVNGQGVNIQRAMAQQRSILFKDGQSAYEYNKEFGVGTVTESIDRVIQNAARNISLMEKFTANPRGYYEGMYQRLLKHPEVSTENKELLREKKGFLDRAFKSVTEPQNVPSRGNLNRAVEGTLDLMVAAKLGSSVLKALPLDQMEAATLLSNLNGKSVTLNTGKIVATYVQTAKMMITDPKEFEQAMNSMLLFSSTVVGRINSDLGHDNPRRGKLATLANLTTKYSGLHAHDEIMRTAIGTAVSEYLGSQADLSYMELKPATKQTIKSYGIGEHEWNLMRTGAQEFLGPSGKATILDATGISTISDDDVSNYLSKSGRVLLGVEPTEEQIYRTRKQMEYMYGAMINEHADFSVARPGSRQKATMLQGFKSHEGMGMALRLFWQMRGASLVTMDNTRRMFNSGGGSGGNWSGVAERIGLAMAAATMAYMLYQLKQGKTLPDPTTPESMLEIVKMSGMSTLIGDTLLAMAPKAYHRRIGDALEAGLEEASGLGLSSALKVGGFGMGELGGLAGGTGDSFKKDLRKKETDFAVGLIPGQNMWWSQAAFNFYIANGLKEFVTSGYLSRLEERAANTPGLFDRDQRYFTLKPTESVQWGK